MGQGEGVLPARLTLPRRFARRAELGLGNEYFQTSAGQRDRLLTATDRLGKTSDRIQAGRQQLLETEVGSGRLSLGAAKRAGGWRGGGVTGANEDKATAPGGVIRAESKRVHGEGAWPAERTSHAQSVLSRRWGRRSCSSSRASGPASSAAGTRRRPWARRSRRQMPRPDAWQSPGGSPGHDAGALCDLLA